MKLLFPISKVIPYANSLVVAPHGITDLFHAYENNNLSNLRQIYTSSLALIPISEMLSSYNSNLHFLDIVFTISSIIHFKHDMPKMILNKQYIRPEIFSTIFILLTPMMGINMFSMYMILHHVPSHYKKCWPIVKKYKEVVLLSILLINGSLISNFLLSKIIVAFIFLLLTKLR